MSAVYGKNICKNAWLLFQNTLHSRLKKHNLMISKVYNLTPKQLAGTLTLHCVNIPATVPTALSQCTRHGVSEIKPSIFLTITI
jgi:hypothetical protein